MHRECQTKRNSFRTFRDSRPRTRPAFCPRRRADYPMGPDRFGTNPGCAFPVMGSAPSPPAHSAAEAAHVGWPRGSRARLPLWDCVVASSAASRSTTDRAFRTASEFAPTLTGLALDVGQTGGCPLRVWAFPTDLRDGRSPLIGTAGREQSGQTLRPQPIHGSRPVEFAPDVVQDSACLFRVSAISSSEART
jgi:hypothetical protein